MKSLVLFALLCSTSFIMAQDFMFLEDINLSKKDHFKEQEPTLVKTVDYLLSTAVDETNMDRKICSRFIIKFAEGTPFTTISLDETVMKLYEGNLDLLTIYIGLWLKSSITNPNKTSSDYEAYIYDQIYQYAKEGNGINRTKPIKSLIKAGDKGDLANWLVKFKK